jgi:predicted N-formylglutamate amidohydrolase
MGWVTEIARGRLMPDPARPALLGEDEPQPFQVMTGGDGSSPFVIICDHGGRVIPRALGSLGLSPVDLESHIAWDIGAAAVARRLGGLLNASVIWQPYSRLVIDCNRPLDASDSIVTQSEWTAIPGNRELGPEDAGARAREIFSPYHEQIRAELDRREHRKRSSILVALHSFTPVFRGVPRPWHVGVLFNRDPRLADLLLRGLRSEVSLTVGCNEPYAASDLTDYSLVQHGERRGIPCVELELRQDLIADGPGQTAWAERLGRLLPAAAEALQLRATENRDSSPQQNTR